MVQKAKEKKSELQCYINGPENLSVSKTYSIEAFIILLFSSKLYGHHTRFDILFFLRSN